MKKLLLLFALLANVAMGWAEDAVTGTYTSNKLDVALSNSTEFVAFQMDIALKDATFVGDPEAALSRLTDNDGTNPFILASNELSDGKLRVIAYNMANRSIAAKAGTLFTVVLTQKPTNVEISNVLFVRSSDLAAIDVNATTKAGGEYRIGDIVGTDNTIDVFDLAAMLKIMSGNIESTYRLELANVVQKDGEPVDYDIFDLAALIQLMASN